MITVKFNNESYNAYVKNYQTGEAETKTSLVDIPYADGQLDLTDYYGVVRYKNRTITINMRIYGSEDIVSIHHNIKNALHGKLAKIEFSDDDEGWYWYGRCSVGQGTRTNDHAYDFTITVDAEPYQYQDEEITETLTEATHINCENSRMLTYPIITASAGITITLGTTSVTVDSGTHAVPSLVLTEGDNDLYVEPSTASVTVTIAYKKGRL